MASHVREQIRKAILSALTGLTTTGTNVTTSMVYPYEKSNLPALSILVARDADEENEGDVMGPDGWRRLVVVVEAREAANAAALEDILDDMCMEVEIAMKSDSGLSALANDVQLYSTEISLDDSGEKPVGLARMSWLVTYRTSSTDPTTAV